MSSGGKRRRATDFKDRSGSAKKRNRFADDLLEKQPLPTPDDTTYRILCPEAQIGSVIGKGGGIIKSLRKESGAKIKILDPLPGAEERVVLIWSTPKDLLNFKEEHGEAKESGRKNDGAKGDREEASKKLAFLCPAQVALFKVHSRIDDGDGGISGHENGDASRQITARILVPNVQIGCLLGKGGKIIEKIRTDTRAQIRILPKDQHPPSALPSDELVLISGDYEVVHKALYEISSRIHKSPPRDRPQGVAVFLPPQPVHLPGGPLPTGNFIPPVNSAFGSDGLGGPLVGHEPPLFPGYGSYDNAGSGPSWPITSSGVPFLPPQSTARTETKASQMEQEFSIRVLCFNAKVGFIIGKGGNAIRQLRESTGTRIKVEDPVPDNDERVISISANEYLDYHMSPVIEATLQLQSKMGDVSAESDGTFTTRLLVPSKQVGCLLGQKGSIITEMRKSTNANIKISRKDLPKCAQEGDELVQIIGDQNTTRSALINILKRLRNHVFKDQIEAEGRSADEVTVPHLAGFSLYGSYPISSASVSSRYELGSSGRISSLTGIGSGLDLEGVSGYSTSHLGLGSLQGPGSSYASSLGYSGGLPTGRMIGGRNIADTSIEVNVPAAAVSTILGSRSGNLKRISQISGAKVKLRDSNSTRGDQTVQISGSSEQIQAAQSLIQGFIHSGQISTGPTLRGIY